jgi:hypothetical protein
MELTRSYVKLSMFVESFVRIKISHKFLFDGNLCVDCYTIRSQDSSVGIETYYGLDDRMIGVRIPARAGNFSLRHRVQIGSGAHPASYPVGTGGSLPWG